MRLVVPGEEEVHVVRRHDAQPHLVRQVAELGVDPRLLGDVGLELDEEVVPAEDLAVGLCDELGLLPVRGGEGRGDLAAEAGAGGDDPLAVGSEDFLVDARLVVEAVDVSRGGELQEVLIPDAVLGQEEQVVPAVLGAGVAAVATVAGSHVGLEADDGLHPGFDALVVELDRAEEGAVVGDGDRRHAKLFGAGGQVRAAAGAVQQRILAVDVQVDELFGWLRHPWPYP